MAQQRDPGELGTALKRARKAAGYSNANLFLAAVKAKAGAAPSYSTYAQWESGEVTPRDESIAPVVAFHRELGTWAEPQAAPDIAGALMALAESTRAMAEELAAMRLERRSLMDQVQELQAMVAEHDLRLGSAPSGSGTAGRGAPASHGQ